MAALCIVAASAGPHGPMSAPLVSAQDDIIEDGGAAEVIGLDDEHFGRVGRLLDTGTKQDLHSAWCSPTNTLYVVGAGGLILRYDGVNWSQMDSGGTTRALNSVWGIDDNTIYAVGDAGELLLWTGQLPWWSNVRLSNFTDRLISISGWPRTGPAGQ